MPPHFQILTDTIFTLAENMGLLLAMTFVYSLFLPLRQRLPNNAQTIGIGLTFGLFAVLIMFNPIILGPGVRLDGRIVVVALASIYGSITAGLITGVVIAPVRLALGGAGAIPSICSVLTVITICYLYKRRYSQEKQLQSRQIIILSFLVWTQMMVWGVLSSPNWLESIVIIGIPSLLFYSLSLLFVGKLLSHEMQRTALENALRESEQRFRQLAEVSDELFWIYDPHAKQPLYVSPAYTRIWGRPVEPLYENASIFLETIHPADRDRVRKALTRPRQETIISEIRIVRLDGEIRWVASHLHPLLNQQGNVERLVGTAEDITERKNAEKQKLELQVERARGKMLREFISSASHDLRTPITVMGTSLYLLGRTGLPEQKTYLDQIETQVYRMRRLVDDMLNISRLDSDDAGLVLEPRALNDFAEEAVQKHMKEATTKERILTSSYTTPSPWVRIDSAQLGHALERLIKNAIAYTNPGDRITVATSQVGQEAVITIADTGLGIDALDLPHVFERFYRADKARGVTSGGAGLGLPIARRIVELHNGRIEVESAPNAGSTFRVILPAVAPEDGAASSQTAQGERRYS